MWSVPEVVIGTTSYSDDAAEAWWQTQINVEVNTSGACPTFYDHLADFGWTSEQGKEFELGIDMRTLVLATAVNDGFISLDPDKVSLSMLPLDKKFYSGPDLTDDLFAGSGAGTFADVPFFDDDFFFSPPTSTVTVTVGLSGIACSDYGDDEESVLVAAMVTTLSDAVSVDSSAFSDTTCSDSRRRRGLLQTSSVSIDMPFSVSSDDVDDYAYNTLESTVSDTVSAAQSSGALDSTIADEASAQSVTSAIASVQATSVYATAVQEDDDAGGYIFTWDDNTYTGGAGYYDFGYYDYGGW